MYTILSFYSLPPTDVVRNQVGLDADAIANEEDNNVLQGLRLSTRNIVSHGKRENLFLFLIVL